MIHVTAHAVERARERCGFKSDAEAIAALSSQVVIAAARFGAPYVKLGTGQRIALEGSVVVTVLPKDQGLGRLDRRIQRRKAA